MISIDYRKFIRSLGCCVEACPLAFKPADCCHTGSHAFGRKSPDLNCIPLCRRHHEQFDANPTKFIERYKIDLPRLIEGLNEIGLPGIHLHRPARKIESPSRCVAGIIPAESDPWIAFQNLIRAHFKASPNCEFYDDKVRIQLIPAALSDSTER